MDEYLEELAAAVRAGNATEHTHRPALKTLLQSLGPGLTATNEPRRVACGAPDFVVTRGATPLGYLETKDLGENLDRVERGEQLQRYLGALGNLILTDYLEFRWYVCGELRLAARLGRVDTNGGNGLSLEPSGPARVRELLSAFLAALVPTVSSPRELAVRMAGLARLMRELIARALREEEPAGELHDQLASFRRVLLPELTQAEFADMFAQTLCYGLFSARMGHVGPQPFTRESAAYDLPKTNPFLREIFGHIAGPRLDDRLVWAVEDLVELLRRADIAAVLKDFGKHTNGEDRVLPFYELFLANYDPAMREARGVYFTPQAVVTYIVRSVDRLLRSEFQMKKGLADSSRVPVEDGNNGAPAGHRLLILDPAVGTGTFLFEVITQALAEIRNPGAHSNYIREHLLPRLVGFELLMAPYAIAHLKLGIKLRELGYDFEGDERLRVYLTNSLEEAHAEAGLPFMARALAEEGRAAAQVKERAPVMVVLGNPPYSGHSANKGPWIAGLLRGFDSLAGVETDSYFKVDGQPLGERNSKWLNDDYVKFIRFAQWRIEKTGHGVLAFITNNGYLDNPTFRGMRQSLLKTFDDVYLLDLHGSSKKKERTPDGGEDQNVFDIQQGVAIGIFVKRTERRTGPGLLRHAHLWGLREKKYDWLWDNDVTTTPWRTLKPRSPDYLFVPRHTVGRAEYERGWRLPEAMPVNSVGIVTAHDDLAIHWSDKEAWRTVNDFAALDAEEARRKYALGRDVQEWKVAWAQEDLRATGPSRAHLARILYRPFDQRWTYYTGNSCGFHCRPRGEVMRHMVLGPNLGLIATRQTRDEWGVLAASTLIGHKALAAYDINSLFPLYLYGGGKTPELLFEHQNGRRPNLSTRLVAELAAKLGLTFVPDGRGDLKQSFGPEDVFHYFYALLHSQTFRERYEEFLRADFPRVPLTSQPRLFRALRGLGETLAALHLGEAVGPRTVDFPVAGTNLVEEVRYSEPGQGAKKGRVWINAEQFFEGVPPKVWSHAVGGYLVCEKWLKDRKGRTLSFDDLERYEGIVAALSETSRLLPRIDRALEAHGGFPLH